MLTSDRSKVIPGEINIMFTDALNQRLGTTGLDIPGVAAAAAEQGMTISELMAVPEQDGWIYSGLEPRDGEAYVCSANGLWPAQ